MLEEGLYFFLLYSRWVDPKGYLAIQGSFKNLFPKFLGRPILWLIRRDLICQSRAQGTGRHSREEVYGMARRQIAALGTLLGENEYFFEDKLTFFDASAFGFFVTIHEQPFSSPLKDELLSQCNLCGYVQRLKSKVLPGGT